MLSVRSLSCRRSGRLIFKDVGFQANGGDFVLLSGSNGSGKSSLLRILSGLLAFHGGDLLWKGSVIDVSQVEHRTRLHYIGHLDALKPELSVSEMLNYWKALRGNEEVDLYACLQTFGLHKLADRPVRLLSAGQKRRLSLTRLLFDEAPLWLLDEPTTALDQEGQNLLWDLLARHLAKGGVIVAAMHDEPQIMPSLRLVMGEAR